MNCVFCNIAEGKSVADFIANDGDVFAIKDAHPMAPTHVLIIPRRHIPTLLELVEEPVSGNGADDRALISKMVSTAVEVAKKISLSDRGFRLVWNCRAEGGQTVDHIHLHLLGGRQMKWPPG